MKKQVSSFLFLSAFLCSCSHYYYVPSTQNVPLFREQNEIRISGTRAGGEESVSNEVQCAYSVTGKIGIMADFMSSRGGDRPANNNWAKGNYFDGAIGYYKPLSKYGVFEIYGGIGRSNQHHHYMSSFSSSGSLSRSDGGISDLSFTKIFVQPSFGFTFKGFDIAASTRICILSFHNINNQITGNVEEYKTLNNISNDSHFFLEPAITIRGGWKYVKLQFQATTASYFNKPDLHFENYHVGIGLYISFSNSYGRDTHKE
jgi:hypothetical protein